MTRVNSALSQAALWDKLDTDWVCLDAELMPWSAKAQTLITDQYAPVGAAGVVATEAAAAVIARAVERGVPAQPLHDQLMARHENVQAYKAAVPQYIWPVHSTDDLKLAPFHIMASRHAVHMDKPHTWHMQMLADVCAVDPGCLIATPHRQVQLADPAQCRVSH